MEYKKFGKTYIVRIDPGEEIVTKVAELATKEKIALAHVNALGAVNEITVGVFDTVKKEYHANTFTGLYEIVSLHGTITEKDGHPYLHLHMSAGDEQGRVIGGHLSAAKVSATCEMVVTELDGHVGRKFSETIGLNLFAF